MCEILNIVIVDDHDFIIQGIKNFFEYNNEFCIAGTAKNGLEALSLMEQIPVDILITDLDMSQMNGFDLIKIVKEKYPDVKIIVISMHIEPWVIKKLNHEGIQVIISKNANCNEMNTAINALLKNKPYISDDIKDAIIESTIQNNNTDKSNPFNVKLTDREFDVLKLIAEELSTAEIATKLFISPNTVETHRRNLLLKLGAKNSVGLIKMALERKLI
jgi:DNA-binding NarL/FixJ family response regulator